MKSIVFLLLVVQTFWSQAQSLDDYVQLGQYAQAIDSYAELKTPTTTDKLALAKAYCAKGMTKSCLETYEDALKTTKADAFLRSKFQYANLLQTQNDNKKADSLYTDLLQIMPEHAEILYQRGEIAKALSNEAYHQFYLDALLYDSKHIKAAHEATRYFMQVENLKIAKKICQKTLDQVPNTPRLINLMAQIYYREEDWQTSLDYINQLEALKEDLPKFIFKIKGNIFLNLNQPDQAVIAFEQAFFKDDSDIDLCLKIAETYLFLDQPDKANRWLVQYEMKKDTSMWRFNFLKGKYFMKNHNYEYAFYLFEKSYKENINHEDSQYYRAVAADYAFEDKSKVLDYYTNYIQTYEIEEDAKYLNSALKRETEIRRELFMKE